MKVERVIQILVADSPERSRDFQALLRQRYALYAAQDDARMLQLVDQARDEGRPFDLILLAEDPPLLGGPQAIQRLSVLTPTTLVVPILPPGSVPPTAPGGAPPRYLVQPVDPASGLALVQDLLAERLAALARTRAEILRPLSGLDEALLRQPDLDRALHRLYHELDGLLGAEYLYVALYDRRRGRLVFLLTFDHGVYVAGQNREFVADQGPAEWVIAHDAPLISGAYSADAARRGWPPGEPDGPFQPVSAMVLPLHLGGEIIGVLSAQSARPAAFGEAEITLFGFVADLLAGVVAHWWTDLQWQRQNDLLIEFDQALTPGVDRQAILVQTADAARKLTAMEAAAVIDLPDGAGAAARVVTADPFAQRYRAALTTLTERLAAAGPGGPLDYAPINQVLTGLGERGVGRIISHALSTGGRVDSMLWLLHHNERPFDGHDQAGLDVLARWGSQALLLEESLRGRQRERQVFARIAWRSAVETNLALLLSSALHEVQKIIPWAGAAIWQADAVLNGLRPVWQEGQRTAIGDRLLPAVSPLFAAAEERNRVVILEEATDERTAVPRGPAVAVSLRHSSAQVPGLLVLERRPEAPPFSAEERALLPLLGQLLAAGLEKLRWYGLADLHRRLGQAAAQGGDGAWDAALAVLAGVLPGAVGLLAPQTGGWRTLGVALGEGNPAIPWNTVGPALLTDLRAGGPPLLFDAAALAARGAAGVGSLAVVPASAGDQVVGALALWTARTRAVGARELEVLRHAAQHLTGVLAAGPRGGGHVYEGRLMGLVAALQDEASSTANTAELLRGILLHALSSTPATLGALFLREAGDRLVLRADYPQGVGTHLPQEVYNRLDRVIRQGQAQYLAGPRGVLACLPVLSAGGAGAPAPLGVLVAGSPRREAFGPAEHTLLSHLAGIAGRMIADHQARDAERALRGVAGLPVPGGQVIARLPALICQALNVPVALVHVLDRRENRFELAGGAGLNPQGEATAALRLPGASPGLTALFATAPEPESSGGGPATPLWPPAVLESLGLRFGLAVPFWVDGRPFGVLSVHTYDGRRLAPGTARRLAVLAGELGAVLEGQQQERRLEALTALSESLVQLTAGDYLPAAPSPDALVGAHLERLLRSALELTDARAAYLFLRSEAPPGLTLRATAGTPPQGAPLPAAEAVGSLRNLDAPRYLADVQMMPLPGHPVFDPATRSSLALPLIYSGPASGGDPVLGVILLESPTPLAVGQEDYRVLRAFAALTTAMLTQHGLVQELRGQTSQAQAALDALGVLLAEADDSQVQARLLTAARQVLDADVVVLYPGDGAPPEVPPQSGNQQAGVLAGSPAMGALIRQVAAAAPARGGTPHFVENLRTQHGAALPEWVTQEAISALALAPLLVGETVVGVLAAGYRTRRRFDHALREGVRLFAVLAALAMQTVHLRARQMATLQEQVQSLNLVAHELREPVDKVHMIIETALHGLWLPMSDTLRERLTVAYNLLDEHYETLGRVLQLGRLQSGAQDLERKPVAVAPLVQAVIARHAEFARAQQVVLRAALDPLLAPQRLALDEGLLTIALSNLVHNAVKFSRAGGSVVVTCTVDYSGGRRALVIQVDDHGIGIPLEAQELIFAPYYQVDHGLDREGGGTGLGLPLARLIAGLHEGTLTVESTPDQGSRFTLRLPFAPA